MEARGVEKGGGHWGHGRPCKVSLGLLKQVGPVSQPVRPRFCLAYQNAVKYACVCVCMCVCVAVTEMDEQERVCVCVCRHVHVSALPGQVTALTRSGSRARSA